MLFVSKIRDLRLIRRPADRIMDEQRRPIILKGERVEFSNFRYQTNDEDVIEWLCSHPLYGKEFTSDKKKDKPVPQDRYVGPETDDEIRAQYNQMLAKMKKKGQKKVPLIRGAMATASPGPQPSLTIAEEKPATPALTEEKVAEMIETKVSSAMEKVLEAIKGMQPPAKRSFHCSDCGQEFRSGIEVGKHKKEAHPTAEVTK